MQDLFGLPCSTTCDSFKPHKNLQPGYNPDIIQHAVELYNGRPVVDASDEARALRYVEIVKAADNLIITFLTISEEIQNIVHYLDFSYFV